MHTAMSKVPDFNKVKRKNMAYDNIFGAQHNTNHPKWETGGDYAALARQTFTTPGMEQRYAGVNKNNVQGYITKLSGQNGRTKMTQLYGQDDFSSRRHENPYAAAINLNKQISLANQSNSSNASSQGGLMVLFIMLCIFLYYAF